MEGQRGRRTGPALRFAIRFLALAAIFYLVLYYPHDPASLPARLLGRYVELQARLAGGLVRLFDRGVTVSGILITGRFSLAIVLDCAAIDAQALFAATVLAFPAPWRRKLTGLAAGLAVITAVNLVRIVILYFVGLRWPRYFDFLHEDLFQFGIIAAAAASFGLWACWATGRLGRQAHAAA
jgi:exosortase/archaeosortase family protein